MVTSTKATSKTTFSKDVEPIGQRMEAFTKESLRVGSAKVKASLNNPIGSFIRAGFMMESSRALES